MKDDYDKLLAEVDRKLEIFRKECPRTEGEWRDQWMRWIDILLEERTRIKKLRDKASPAQSIRRE